MKSCCPSGGIYWPDWLCTSTLSMLSHSRPLPCSDATNATRSQVQRFALKTRGDEAALPILSTTVRSSSSMSSTDEA